MAVHGRPPSDGVRRRLRVASALVVAMLALAACAVESNVPILADRSVDGVTTAPGALFRGQLEVVDGCLAVSDENVSYLVAWPGGTTWDELSGTVHVGDVDLQVGDAVALGGGEYGIPGRINADDWSNPPTEECLDRFEKLWWATEVEPG